MYHTSPEKIAPNSINHYGVAGDCLFFSDNIYLMTAQNSCYVYEADFNCIAATDLYDETIIKDIAKRFNCNEGIAEGLLDSRENEWTQEFECDAEDSWWLQGKRGECAKKMGYDGCEDSDEQGTVYIIPMFGRESELKLMKKTKEK